MWTSLRSSLTAETKYSALPRPAEARDSQSITITIAITRTMPFLGVEPKFFTRRGWINHANMNTMGPQKICFVTTGATAKFPELIEAVFQPECIQLLKDAKFTQLIVQCGESIEDIAELSKNLASDDELGLVSFDFKPDLKREMRLCQAVEDREGGFNIREKGLVITHAGAGTVMDAMRFGLSMIVVPNDTLLDNHQDELAKELHVQNYATRATTKDLATGIRRAVAWQAQPWQTSAARFSTMVDTTVGYPETEDVVRSEKAYKIIEFREVRQVDLLNY